MKLVVVANCQARPIATSINLLSSRDVKSTTIIVHEADQKKCDFYIKEMQSADLILHFPVSDKFKINELSSNFISSQFSGKSLLIPNVYYDGYHPDACYVGALDKRVPGILGDYHSKLSIFGYIKGISPDILLKAFNAPDFCNVVGYTAQRQKSLDEFAKRHKDCDVDFSEKLKELTSQESGVSFYSFNHPMRRVFLELAKSILQITGEKIYLVGENYFPEYLHYGPILPVSESIAKGYNFVKLPGKNTIRTLDWFFKYTKGFYKHHDDAVRNYYEKNKALFTIMEQELGK